MVEEKERQKMNWKTEEVEGEEGKRPRRKAVAKPWLRKDRRRRRMMIKTNVIFYP